MGFTITELLEQADEEKTVKSEMQRELAFSCKRLNRAEIHRNDFSSESRYQGINN